MQTTLSHLFSSKSPEIISLIDGEITLYPDFLEPAFAGNCYQDLLEATSWQQDSLKFGGKDIPIPRLQAWHGDKHSNYGYSGLTLVPKVWTPLLLQLKNRIQTTTNAEFNSVLLNYYRDGRDSVAWHSDDEKELGSHPVIASLSLGATRRFELKHRDKKGVNIKCELTHGSLLVMGKDIQQHWRHQIPKQPEIRSGRINLTFRFINKFSE